MKFKYCLSAALIGISVAVVQPAFQARSQEGANEFGQLQSLLAASSEKLSRKTAQKVSKKCLKRQVSQILSNQK